MKTRIHVNGQNLRDNRVRKDNGKRNTVFVAHCEQRGMRKGTRVEIQGPAVLVYRPTGRTLTYNGARVSAFIETEAPVDVYWGKDKV